MAMQDFIRSHIQAFGGHYKDYGDRLLCDFIDAFVAERCAEELMELGVGRSIEIMISGTRISIGAKRSKVLRIAIHP